MKMQKRKFRIGHLAQHLDVERFVIRFWEKEFNIKPTRSDGGQRFYDEHDLSMFENIKDLLYKRKFTIAGAKKQLGTKDKDRSIIGSHKTIMLSSEITQDAHIPKDLEQKLIKFKKQLIALKEIL